jgi:hypothetical protein
LIQNLDGYRFVDRTVQMQTIQTTGANAQLGNRGTGALFFSVFGAVWLCAWARSSGAGAAAFVAIAVLGALLFGFAWQCYRRDAPLAAQFKDTPERRRIGRVFNIVNSAQWTLIVGLAFVLGNTGHGAWIIPMAIGIVGLHFFPLAVVFRNRAHWVTGAAMLALAVAYPLLAGPTSPVGFLGAGLILWASAAWALRPRRLATS